MTKALISIDYTNDFVASNGKLTAGERAQSIEEALVFTTKQAYQNGEFIFFAIDAHQKQDSFHPETNLFPPHNIIGTSGRHLYGQLGDFYDEIKEDSHVLWIDKRHYSAFSGTDLDIRLRERKVDTVVLSGVLTDICVLHTAISAYQLGYRIEVVKSAVAALTDTAHEFALHHMKNILGAKIV